MDVVVKLTRTLAGNLLITPAEFQAVSTVYKISPNAFSLRLEKSNTFFTFILDATNTFNIHWDPTIKQWIQNPSMSNNMLGAIAAGTNQVDTVVFRIIIQNNCPGQEPVCKMNDTYMITIHYTMDAVGDIPNPVKVDITFTRKKEENNTPVMMPVMIAENNISINIQGQTLLYGTDIGNTIFTIKEDDIITIYDKCAVKIIDVVRGKGNDLYDKLNDIFNNDIGVPLTIFYANLFLYAILKYILAKLLYGKFSTKYLLRKYNKQFLHDLANSRYREFLIFFTECVEDICIYTYDQYFKYSLKEY